MRKPTVSAWAVNQIARRRPEEIRALVKSGDELRKAQRAAVSGRDPQALRAAQRRHRELLDDVTSLARHELELSASTAQRVAQTLRAASIDKEASKGLIAGTLTEDVEQPGFGPLLTAVPSRPRRRRATPPKAKPSAKPKPPPKPEPPPKAKPDPKAARRRRVEQQLERARARVRELEAQLNELT